MHALEGVEIAVPGSTSNLGAGFDALGLALSVYLRLRITGVDERRRNSVTWRFTGAVPPGENSIQTGFRALADPAGLSFPGLSVEVSSDIPMQSGLGSSAAAIVAGLRLYERVAGDQPPERLLAVAARLEGHPDNTSASILGGFVVSARTPDGEVAAIASPWPESLQVVIATPAVPLDTRQARAALPAAVPLADAVYNLQRTALLVQAVARGDVRWLRESVRDRLHQPYRAPLAPGLDEALRFEHPSLSGVFLSGAGPSIAALVSGDTEPVHSLFRSLYARLGIPATVRTLAVHQPTAAQRAVSPVPTR